jgi:protein involved in polysaccharide export with SLBB domain
MTRTSNAVAVKVATAFLLVLLSLSVAFPQTGTQSKDLLNLPDFQSLKATLAPQTKELDMRDAVPMDAPLNPAEYVVGPGDRLALNIWSSSPVEVTVTVTPEGALIVPGVGILDLKGLTLAEAKSRVRTLVGRKYVNAEVSLTLLVPRKVAVTILGHVMYEGKKNVYATQRVEDLIQLANDFPTGRMTAEEYADELNRLRAMRSERKIALTHRKGQTVRVDLVRYRITGDGWYNPYLQEGDIVYVPERGDADNAIGVFGATMQSANFEFVPGDSLSLLVGLGFGFTRQANPRNAILTRLVDDGKHMDTVRVDALAIQQGRGADLPLRPGDRLVFPTPAEQLGNFRVTIEGEVGMPGTYPITRENTKLSEVIRLAGGFTSRANLSGAAVFRKKSDGIDRAQIEREQLLSLRASLPVQDTSYYHVESTLRLSDEAVTVDFRQLFVKGDSTQDVTLRTRDKIVIPPQQHTVYVFGQVVSPGHVAFVPGESYKHYVERAGGFGNEARTGEVKVIKCGTRVWLDPGETAVEDGDMIWVPRETTYPFSHYATIYAQIAGIIGAVATVALLINSF